MQKNNDLQDLSSRWNQRFYLLLLSVTLWRALFLFIAPLDLVPDEAYYWDWSRQLAWGYYSKPPMIAWIDALSTGVGGVHAATVRLPAVILGTVGIWALFLLARRLYNPRVAFWAAAAVIASPGSAALNFIMTIDAPLLCFWSLSLYALWRALESRGDRVKWWLLCALTVGLGLLSKQMMIVFLVLLLLFLVLHREDRFLLKRPWPYLLIGLSLLALLPVLWWNMQHEWITFHHTAQHFHRPGKGSWHFLTTFLEFVGSQLLVVTPVTCLLFAMVTGKLLFKLPDLDRRARFLLVFSALSLAVFVLMSFRQRLNANWPAAFYPAGLILLSAWGCGSVSCGPKLDRWRRFFLPGIGVGAGLVILTYALPFILWATGLKGGSLDPTVRLKGWEALGQQVGARLQVQPRPDKTFLLATSRQYASELAFYVPDQPRVFRWPGDGREVSSQYEIWDGPLDRTGWDALILLKGSQPPPPDLTARFLAVEPAGRIDIPPGKAGRGGCSLYLGRGLKSWPR